ncbi:MAG TPA: hypothetical protein DCE39_05180 [Planctomycetaceae bacterium]|nr:hypothetical protein [Planctomycetaceae bacterium]
MYQILHVLSRPPPTIDGDLRDWTQQRPVELPLSMRTDARRIKVSGPVATSAPLTPAMDWGNGNQTLHRQNMTHPREQVRVAARGRLRFLD